MEKCPWRIRSDETSRGFITDFSLLPASNFTARVRDNEWCSFGMIQSLFLNKTTILGLLLLTAISAQLAGCGDAKDMSEQAKTAPKDNESLTEQESVQPSEGFSWIVPGKLAAMPVPGQDRPLDQDAAFLEEEGIRVLVSLTEEPPDREVLASRFIDQGHIPVQDFTAPTLEQMIAFVAVVEDSVAAGKPVGVHCTAGLGRSGTMAAVFLVAEGASADEAITSLRRLRPGSIETEAQEEAVRRFEKHLATTR